MTGWSLKWVLLTTILLLFFSLAIYIVNIDSYELEPNNTSPVKIIENSSLSEFPPPQDLSTDDESQSAINIQKEDEETFPERTRKAIDENRVYNLCNQKNITSGLKQRLHRAGCKDSIADSATQK